MSAEHLSFSDQASASDVSVLLQTAETVTGRPVENAAEFVEALRTLGATEDSKTKKLRRQINALKLEMDRKDAELAKAEIEISALKLANQNSERKIARLTNEIKSLKQQIATESTPTNSSPNLDDAMNLFDEVIAHQANEISQLAKQRDVLITSVNSLDNLCRSYEDTISEMQREAQNTSDIVDRVKTRLEETEGEIATLAKEVSEITEIEINTREQSYSYVLRAVRELMNREVQLVTPTVDHSNDDGKLTILGQLEDAVKFMQEMATAGEEQSRGEDSFLAANESVRSVLLTQCARIERFIDDNLSAIGESILPEKPSLFRPSSVNGLGIQLSEYFCYVTQEELRAPAMRELFAMFVGVVQVNHAMSDYFDRLKGRKHSSRVQQLEEWKAEITEQTQMAMKEIQNNGGHVEDDNDVIPWLLNAWIEKQRDNQELEETLMNINTNETEKTADKEEIQAFRKQLEVLEADIIKEKEASEKQMKSMAGQLKKSEKEKKALESQIKKFKEGAKEYKAKYKQSMQEVAETTRLFQEVQAKVSDIVKEKVVMETTISDLKQTIKKQNDQILLLVSKERKFHSNKERLEERIHDLENQNKQVLSDIKKSNETLKQQYEATIDNIKSDLEDVQAVLEREKKERQKLLAEKQAISAELTKTRVSERALRIKLTSLEERQNIERSAQNAKTSSYFMSLNATAGKKLDEANNRIETVKTWLISTLTHSFHQSVSANLSLDALFELLQEQVTANITNERVLYDALELRKKLNVPKSVTLSAIVTSMQREVAIGKERFEDAQTEILRLQKQLADYPDGLRLSLSQSE